MGEPRSWEVHELPLLTTELIEKPQVEGLIDAAPECQEATVRAR